MRILIRRSKRGMAMLLLAMLAFTQAQVSLAACQMDRGAMATTGCEGCNAVPAPDDAMGLSAACVSHCTSDLQLSGIPVTDAPLPPSAPALLLSDSWPPPAWHAVVHAPPPRAVPARVLLHSYLI
jgi:hypothetical protein